jgi:hypothetical protein
MASNFSIVARATGVSKPRVPTNPQQLALVQLRLAFSEKIKGDAASMEAQAMVVSIVALACLRDLRAAMSRPDEGAP